MVSIKRIIEWAERLKGIPYIFGTEQDGRPKPKAEDCSELIQNACDQNGVVPKMPDGAYNQYKHCKNHDTLIGIREGIDTYGALLFRIEGPDGPNHVAFSLSNGKTFEARGKAYGVGSWSANGRPWTHAALIPGVDYGDSTEEGEE